MRVTSSTTSAASWVRRAPEPLPMSTMHRGSELSVAGRGAQALVQEARRFGGRSPHWRRWMCGNAARAHGVCRRCDWRRSMHRPTCEGEASTGHRTCRHASTPLGFGAVSDAAPSRLRIAIVGSGRVGAVLGAAWHRGWTPHRGSDSSIGDFSASRRRCCRVSGLPTRQRLLPTLISSSLLFPIRICRVWWRNSWHPARWVRGNSLCTPPAATAFEFSSAPPTWGRSRLLSIRPFP